MSGIIFRKYQIGDEKGLNLLAKDIWGFEFSEDYWRWKYLDNPLRDNYSYVAESDGRVIGFSGCIPWRLFVTGKEVIGAQMTDMMVHPEWRRKNIYFPLNRCTLEDIRRRTDLQYGFGNPSSFSIYKKRFKYDGFSPVKMQKILDMKLLLRQGLKKIKSTEMYRLLRIVPKVLASLSGKSTNLSASAGKNIVAKRIHQFDARFDEFWDKNRMVFPITTIRDRQYLEWRYLENPGFSYTILAAEQQDKLTGFAVLRCEKKNGIDRGMIVDFLVDPEYEASADLILEESMKFFRSQKVAMVTAWISSEQSPSCRFLAARGFSADPVEGVMILIKSFTQDLEDAFLRDPENWYLTMGDCEVF